MGQEIRCTVNSCYYWAADDRCAAERIMVRNNPHSPPSSGLEAAGGNMGAVSGASESAHTMCETFIPEARGPKPGINRLNMPRHKGAGG